MTQPYKTVNAYTVQLVTTGDGRRALVMRPAPGTADFLVMELAEARHALECGANATVVCGDDKPLAAMMGAGGDKCGCNGAVPHELHICRNPKCPRHTAAYHMELTHDGAGREYYVPQGARLSVRKQGEVGE